MTQLDLSIIINIPTQTMQVLDKGDIVKSYLVSTATNGVGCIKDSYQTPTGEHIIRAKIGGGCAAYTYFEGRRPKGVWSSELFSTFPDKDWILSRILWLSGTEKGHNRLGKVDTMQRYIYIHGMARESQVGTPCSKGCINMLNQDIIELFDNIPIYTRVSIRG